MCYLPVPVLTSDKWRAPLQGCRCVRDVWASCGALQERRRVYQNLMRLNDPEIDALEAWRMLGNPDAR